MGTNDPWDYFDEKRDALWRLENDLSQFRDNEGASAVGKANQLLRLGAVHRVARWRSGNAAARHASASARNP